MMLPSSDHTIHVDTLFDPHRNFSHHKDLDDSDTYLEYCWIEGDHDIQLLTLPDQKNIHEDMEGQAQY